MSCPAGEIIALLEEVAPPAWAEEWDNVGLQAGSPRTPVDAVLVCLDLTAETLEEARERGAGLVVTHHPLIFRPLRSLAEGCIEADLLREALSRGICVYAAHTNLDVSPLGVSAALAERLGLPEHRPLSPPPHGLHYKLATFLPPGEVAAVSEALFAAGAGVIGDYTGCSFRLEGTGTFTPGPGAHPSYGEAGRPNEVAEVRLEVKVEGDRLEAVLGALLSSHPYEEPAYDVYPLREVAVGAGLGRMGELRARTRLAELAERCSRELGNPAVRLAGDPDRMVSRVAVCGGSGGDLVPVAARAGAEVLVTGDVSYHAARDALALGMAVIDAGHFHTERPVVGHLASLLAQRAEEKGLEVEMLASESDTCPWSDGGVD